MAKVSDLVNVIINDGNGSQCGYTYERRCAVACTSRQVIPWITMVGNTAAWYVSHGQPEFRDLRPSQILAAASDVADWHEQDLPLRGPNS